MNDTPSPKEASAALLSSMQPIPQPILWKSLKGKVTKYEESKGYGFVRCIEGKEYFFHINSCFGSEPVSTGRVVHFMIDENCTGRRTAWNVNVAPEWTRMKPPQWSYRNESTMKRSRSPSPNRYRPAFRTRSGSRSPTRVMRKSRSRSRSCSSSSSDSSEYRKERKEKKKRKEKKEKKKERKEKKRRKKEKRERQKMR